MGYKKWVVRETDKEFAKQIAEECGIDPLCALLLTARGMDEPEVIEDFIFGDSQLRDPYEMADMQEAVNRICIAIENDETIAVYGDYDADGVTSTALLCSYLKTRTPHVVTYIPDRCDEGYGMNCDSIDRLSEQGVTLIITVDNGISCIKEVEYAASLDMDVVVTDHHLPGETLPAAVAVVDPHREDCPSEFKDYAGVGVAFKLICALEGGACEELLPHFGAYVALGTVADVVPLVDENRILVREGVKVINARRHPGLNSLIAAAGLRDKPIGVSQIAYQLAPRINATGRMGSPQPALDLLLTQDREQAYALSTEIAARNTQRQAVEKDVFEEAVRLIEQEQKQYRRVIVVWGNGWHPGVLGIVAARLMERYGKPSIVLQVQGDTAHGSARSYGEFSMYDALCAASEHLTGFGGHRQAAGMTLDSKNLESFDTAVNAYAASVCPTLIPTLEIDCKLNPRGLTTETAKAIRVLEPYGTANPVPLFGLFGMTLDRVTPVGENHHLRLSLSRDGTVVTAMKFFTSPEEFPYVAGDSLDLVVTLEINDFRGQESVSVVVRDLRPATLEEAFFDGWFDYESLMRQETQILAPLRVLPDRDDFAQVYRRLRANRNRCDALDRMYVSLGGRVGYAKLQCCLDIFRELGLAEVTPLDENRFTCDLLPVTEKRDLESSGILKNLRERLENGV